MDQAATRHHLLFSHSEEALPKGVRNALANRWTCRRQGVWTQNELRKAPLDDETPPQLAGGSGSRCHERAVRLIYPRQPTKPSHRTAWQAPTCRGSLRTYNRRSVTAWHWSFLRKYVLLSSLFFWCSGWCRKSLFSFQLGMPLAVEMIHSVTKSGTWVNLSDATG